MVCTLESISRIHPDLALIVVFAKPAAKLDLRENKALAQVLPHAPNVFLATVDYLEAFKGSVFEGIEERFNRSVAPLQHVSDALRLFLIWRVGGVYMDLDMVFHKSLGHLLHKNFIYAASTIQINNCFFGFKKVKNIKYFTIKNFKLAII